MRPVRGGPNGRADYDEQGRGNEGCLATDPVTQEADRDLAKDRTWERTVRIIIPRIRQGTQFAALAHQRGARSTPGSRRLGYTPSDTIS